MTTTIKQTTDNYIDETYSRNLLLNIKKNLMKERDNICLQEERSEEDQQLISKANHLLNVVEERRDFLNNIYHGYLVETITNHFHTNTNDYPESKNEFIKVISAEMMRTDRSKAYYTPKAAYEEAYNRLKTDDAIFLDYESTKDWFLDGTTQTFRSFRRLPETNQNVYTNTELYTIRNPPLSQDNIVPISSRQPAVA